MLPTAEPCVVSLCLSRYALHIDAGLLIGKKVAKIPNCPNKHLPQLIDEEFLYDER